MALVNGATYRFENRADPNRSLNVYGTSPASLANVCLWTSDDDDICQQWVYRVTGGHAYLLCKGNQNLALDLYTGSGSSTVKNYNAHVCEPSATSYIEIEESDGDYIQIKLENYSNKYLTANQGSNGTSGGKDVNAAGNVYFYNGGLTDDSQDWLPVRLDGGSTPTPGPEPSNGQKLRLPINGENVISASRATSWDDAYTVEYGQPHYGGDIACANRTRLYGLGKGKVVGTGWNDLEGNYITVQYDSCIPVDGSAAKDIVIRYFHMNEVNSNLEIGDAVTTSTLLGYSGNTGAWAFGAYHVHIEADRDTEYPNYTPSIPASGNGGGLMSGNDSTGENPFDWFYTYSGQSKSRYWDSDDSWVFPEDMVEHDPND